MGTTVEKADYAFETKDLLKTEINKINNVLDDNSTFRSYPQELFNGYLDVLNNGTDTLWNNLEKVSASGEEATLENVETAPIKMVLNGNTSQDTTSGKNLFDKDNEQKIVINSTTGTERYGIIIEAPNKKVSFSGTWLSDNNLAYKLINGETYGSYVSFNSPITIDVQDKILFYNGTENQKLGAIVDKIQIEIGTITSYEPYTGGQPSPSPDYPQQVKVVKGENVVSVQGKNLYDVTKHTNTLEANTTIISANEYTCNVVTAWRGRVIVPINDFKKNTDYTFSYVSNNPRSIISRINGVKDGVSTTLASNYYYQYTNKATINTDEYDQIVVDLFATGNNNTIENTIISNIQFEEGTTITSFVPYSKTDYPINLGDIELCKINTYKDYFHKDSGKWYVHKEVGKVVLDGTETWNLITGTDRRFYTSSSTPLAMVIEVVGGRKFGELVSNAFMCQKGYTSDLKMFLQVSNNNVNNLGFTDINSSFEDTSSVTTWLSSNNTIVYYVLATPTEEEIKNTTLIEQLEAISKAKSVKDKTYITQTNDELPFILDVEAIKEYEVN